MNRSPAEMIRRAAGLLPAAAFGLLIQSDGLGAAPGRVFRVPADSPALKMACYPIGDVAGVRLGLLPGARTARRSPP